MRSADLQRSALRVRVAGACLLAAFALLAVRAAQLSVVDERGARRGEAQTGTVLRLAPARGLLVDRSGAELAITVSAPSVYAVPRALEDVEAAARALAPVLGADVAGLRRRLAHRSPFVFLARWTSEEKAARVEALGLSGIGIVHEPRRVYPHRGLAAPLVGFANIDGEGVRGIEQREDAWLRGNAQKIAVERDARGQLLAGSGHDPRSAAGGDVALTLDAALQAEAEQALEEVVAATGARGGLVVALDPRTGDVLTAAERPGFDPNAFRDTPYPQTRSRIFLDAHEPGSSLKPFVVAAALERGVATPDELIDCENGSFRVPGKTLHDFHPHGLLDLAGVLRVSSNIGAAKMGYRVGAEAHYALLRAFGFGEATGAGFPDESSGLLRDWHEWRPVDHATISFGQGINVTAIQLAAAVATFANDGVWRRPRLVAARREPGGPWQPEPVAAGRRVVRRDVARRVRAMLEGVVGPEGTGRYAGLVDVRVAGKTGTAQKLEPDGSYSRDRYLGWFVGVVPAEDPVITVVTMLDEPRGRIHTGGATAAPLFARVAASQLARFGVVTAPARELPAFARIDESRPAPTPPARRAPAPAPSPAPAATLARAAAPSPAPTPAPAPARPMPDLVRLGDRVLLPDFRGLTATQVRQITAAASIELKTSGMGRAVAQDPAPGTIVAGRTRRVSVRFAPGKDG